VFSRITTVVLALLLVATGIWGYREHREKQALLIKAENQYQRAFHDLSDHMNLLQDELGKSLAVNSKLQRTSSLTEVWRLAAEARSDVGELPLTLMPFNSTMNFLNDVGNFSYRVAVRTEDKNDDRKGLNDAEWKTLQALYDRSKKLENQLGSLQTAVIANNLRWMDAELALSQSDKKTDNVIVDGFRAMEKSIASQKSLNFGPTMNSMKMRSVASEDRLSGQPVNEQQAARKIQEFFGLPDTKNIIVQRNGKGTPYSSYSVTVKREKGSNIYATIAVKGGLIMSFMDNRDVASEGIDLYRGVEPARSFLAKHGIQATELVQQETYDNVGVYDFVPVQNGVRIYPQKVTVKVALDNGDVVGLNAMDHNFNHKTRTLAQPKITEEQARKFVSPKVNVQEAHQAVVLNELRQEEQVYVFTGTMDNDTYKIYISAMDGDEVGVEKLN